MSLASKLWNNAMDRLLESVTGHKFNKERYLDIDKKAGRCIYCNALCLDVMDDYKKGTAKPCSIIYQGDGI